MPPLFIFASSRSNGHTRLALQNVIGTHDAELIDLAQHKISFFDYTHANDGDDFLAIAKRMIHGRTIVFCTPIYWYAMSAQMKVFFDRLSDLLGIHKEIEAELTGSRVFLIATGADPELPEGFEVPFRDTARYFKMRYEGALYFEAHQGKLISPAADEMAKAFAQHIFSGYT